MEEHTQEIISMTIWNTILIVGVIWLCFAIESGWPLLGLGFHFSYKSTWDRDNKPDSKKTEEGKPCA